MVKVSEIKGIVSLWKEIDYQAANGYKEETQFWVALLRLIEIVGNIGMELREHTKEKGLVNNESE